MSGGGQLDLDAERKLVKDLVVGETGDLHVLSRVVLDSQEFLRGSTHGALDFVPNEADDVDFRAWGIAFLEVAQQGLETAG